MMLSFKNKLFPLPADRRANSGFGLIELMIGMVVMSIVATGVFATFQTSRRSAMTQRQVADMQQQLRGSFYVMEKEIRGAGFDPTGAGPAAGTPAGITDIRKYGIAATPNPPGAPNLAGRPVLTMTFDRDQFGVSDGVLEQSTYLLYDIDNDGIVDLARTTDGGITYDLVAEGIQDIGFAYAIDDDLDGFLDMSPNGNMIWAVDSDNDNLLDLILDTNDDGVIDEGDITGGGVALAAPVALDRIRMVRIWLLCRSSRPTQQATIDSRSYLVGDRIVPAANDNFRRLTLEISTKCRNLGL
ncbi:MAG: prepilin-type N-terminal cleavage/methylation domain-containing protein [Pseudomonadota bacterium]